MTLKMLSVNLFFIVQSLMKMNLIENFILAVPDEIFKTVFQKEFHDLLIKNNLAKVFGVNEEKEEIIGWIK